MFLAYINKVEGQSLDARSNLAVLDMHAGLPHNFVNDIYEDTRGFIWISTYGGGLTRYDGYSFLSFTFGNRRLSLRSNSCRNVVEDRFGRLWVSFDEGTDVIYRQSPSIATRKTISGCSPIAISIDSHSMKRAIFAILTRENTPATLLKYTYATLTPTGLYGFPLADG